MPAANSLHGGTQPEAGTTVVSSTGTTPKFLRMAWATRRRRSCLPGRVRLCATPHFSSGSVHDLHFWWRCDGPGMPGPYTEPS